MPDSCVRIIFHTRATFSLIEEQIEHIEAQQTVQMHG